VNNDSSVIYIFTRITFHLRLTVFKECLNYVAEARHSIDCITDAGHSIALNKKVLRGVVSSHDETAMWDRLVAHF